MKVRVSGEMSLSPTLAPSRTQKSIKIAYLRCLFFVISCSLWVQLNFFPQQKPLYILAPPLPQSPTNWHLLFTSTRVTSGAAADANLQHPLEGAQGGEQEQDPLFFGETGRTGVQVARYFQELIL